MVQAFLAFSCLLVAGSWIVKVDVVVADAGFATATRGSRIAEIVISAFVTTGTRVAGFAIAPAWRKESVYIRNKTRELKCIRRFWFLNSPDFLVPGLSGIGHEGASVGELLRGIQASWAHARTAWDARSAQTRVAIITVLTTIAIRTRCEVLREKKCK